MLYSYRRKSSLTVFCKMFCFVFAAFHFKVQAQVFISKNPDYLKVKTEQNNLISTYSPTYPDTTVTDLNNFFPRNFRGNLGLAMPNYFFDSHFDNLGFRYLQSPFVVDQIVDDQIEFYRTIGPYANLSAMAGSKFLQAFKLLFTHTYKQKVNLTLRFNRYSSQGYFKKQQTYANNFYLSSNAVSSKKRVGYYFYILNNGNKSQENGGIKNGTLTDSTESLGKDLFAVNLTAANRDNRETKMMINPWLRLSAPADSINGVTHLLQLKSKGSISSYKYKDLNINTDDYYSSNFLDTLKTLDSSNVRQLSNELSYSLRGGKNVVNFSVGYKNEITRIWQHNENMFVNHLLVSEFIIKSPEKIKDSSQHNENSFVSRFDVQYALSGYNAGNYQIENQSFYCFNQKKFNTFYFNFRYEKRSPDRIYNDWKSNHFVWNNNGYLPQETMHSLVGIQFGKKLQASLLYQNVFRYLYFDEAASPRQHNRTIVKLGATLNYSVVFLKHLGLIINYNYQYTTNTDLIRIPSNTLNTKLFYTGNLFKNALQLQLGTQIQIYQSFYAYAYMPATQSFYLQNTFKTADFPYVDFFLNARIRPVAFFLKFENALSGIAGVNYALVPGDYQPTKAFRFGLSWTFFD